MPRDFTEKSQRAYRILVFRSEQAETMPGYVERVAFAPLELDSKKQRAIGLLNETPKWAYDDETPAIGAAGVLGRLGDIQVATVVLVGSQDDPATIAGAETVASSA